MAGSTVHDRLVRACLCAKHFRPARLHTLARALGLALATAAVALAGAASATGVAAVSVIPTSGGILPSIVGGEDSVLNVHIHNNAHVNVTSVPVGTSVHPALSVQGLSGTPTGNVEIRVYATGDCSGPMDIDWTATLSGGSVDASTDVFSSTTVRSRSIRAQYLGDKTYGLSVGPCVPIAFTKATPDVTLTIHDSAHHSVSTVPFTATVHAYATVDGHAGAPTNWFLVRGWTNGDCSGTDYVFATKNVDADGAVDGVLPLGFDKPGVRSYKAHYSGDARYNGVWTDCVAVTATKIKPTLTFGLHDAAHDAAPSTVLVDTPIHTAFGVTGTAGQPTGDIVVREYSDATCDSQVSSFGVAATSWLDADQIVEQLGSPGLRSWQATYEGDTRYVPVSSTCRTVRWLGEPSVDLSIHNASHSPVTTVFVGTKVHFRASVAGDFSTPTGEVVLRKATSSSCGTSSALGSGTLSGGVLHDSSISFTPSSTGTFWFQASYKGDSKYVSRKSACVALKVTAVPATPSPTPAITPKPTTAPTPKPTAVPTLAPTPEPSAAPSPQAPAAPSTSPSDAPSAASTAPSTAPDPTDEVAGSTDVPAASGDATTGTVAGPDATSGLAGGPVTPTSGDASGAGSFLPILLLIVVVLAGAVGLWFGLASRRRRAAR